MKKQLLLGSALLAAMSAFPQSGRVKPQPSGMVDMAARYAHKYDMINNPNEKSGDPSTIIKPIGPVHPVQQRSSAATTWQALSGSMNIYGVIVSNAKPLQYNSSLDAVSFVHRKSFTYVTSPAITNPTTAASGAIVTQVSSSINGLTWDSTLVWANTANWARYPQGAIYNPPGNISLSNAYAVVAGPVTQANTALGWVGSYLASKKLNVFNNVASTVSGAQQYISNSPAVTPPVYGTIGKIDFPRYDMTVTGDTVRAVGTIVNNVNGTGAAYGFRGANVIKGYLDQVTGTMIWKGDSVIPNVEMTSGGTPVIFGEPHMAWNNSGSVGFVWFIGCRSGNTGANKGYQPIVYKTETYGRSWTEVQGINFNSPTYSIVTSRLDSARGFVGANYGPMYRAPQFNTGEGFDGIVDANNKLHIVATIISTGKEDVDSLGYYFTYLNNDGERYQYPHVPGYRPYIYDFTEGATPGAWKVTVIDSMSSEGPGTRSGDAGYGANPWDAAGGTSNTDKIQSEARIQLSRSQDGKYLLYSWAESDTAFTSSQFKWNTIPNVKVRAVQITSVAVGANVASVLNKSNGEINATSAASGNAFVQSNAQMHFVSPIAKVVSSTSITANFKLPMTVSNNQNVPMTQLLPNTHWYATTDLTFTFPTTINIAEYNLISVNNILLFPNPAKNNASVLIDLQDNAKVDINVMNLVGDVVKTSSLNAASGENEINVDLSGLSSGIYMVNVKVGGASTTKKLIVE
jgi:hypothetical protein